MISVIAMSRFCVTGEKIHSDKDSVKQSLPSLFFSVLDNVLQEKQGDLEHLSISGDQGVHEVSEGGI